MVCAYMSGSMAGDRRDRRGFTLVEIMMVSAVLGIVMSLGLTQYRSYVAKSKRTEAFLGLAAIRTGRRFVCIEIDEKYCEIARQRIKNELAQPSLWAGAAT